MNVTQFEDALHSHDLSDWFVDNINNLISGTAAFSRENNITAEIVNCIGDPNIVSHRGSKDILDTHNGDIGEAAHNGTFQPASFGPEHIISDFCKRLGQGAAGDFYGLMYLMDIENIATPTILPDSYASAIRSIPRPLLLQTKYQVENYLLRIPCKIRIHEPFHNLQSPTETTILNYDIYVVKMSFNNNTALALYNEFHNEDFFKRVGFNYQLLDC